MDVNTLFGHILPMVARFAIQQSVFLAHSLRIVQGGVVPGGTFSFNGVSSAAATSLFDQNISVSEALPLDLVNKYPSLALDLALRLGAVAGRTIDKMIAATYASLTAASAVGASGSTPTAANIAAQINALPVTGEPVIVVLTSATRAAFLAANPSSVGFQADANGQAPLVQIAGATRLCRLLASDEITASSGNRNLVFLPSAFVFATADLLGSYGSAPVITPGGTVTSVASTYTDPEYGMSALAGLPGTGAPQLTLQLVIGNSGTGNQVVYVNMLGAPIVANPGRGAVVLS